MSRPYLLCSQRSLASLLALCLSPSLAWAQAAPTAGYPEPVVQWGVQKGETCDDVAKALYGSTKHAALALRYNRVSCAGALPEGTTLVMPAQPTQLPPARLRSMHPDVRARPEGGGWATGASGMPLQKNHNVQTMDAGRADIEFSDRTRVFLAPHTLVVIFGTASQTRVSKAVPPAVQVESGEVRAGLAALRGEGMEVSTPDGGRVSAASRDTVIGRKGQTTTVSVFDGKAKVSSAGKHVDVPQNHGSKFVAKEAPTPPRPLPPAPAWAEGSAAPIVIEPSTRGLLTASWQKVTGAVTYRVELSRDDAFIDLLAREEVPPDVTAFRAEKLPPGTYFLRVRAIDREDFLGIAATRRVEMVHADVVGGVIEGAGIRADRYTQIKLVAPPSVELSVDEGPFGPAPGELDLRRGAPQKLRLQSASGKIEVPIAYAPHEATLSAEAKAEGKVVSVRVLFAEGALPGLSERARPRVRARLGDRVQDLETRAEGGALVASFDAGDAVGSLRFDVIDEQGRVLGGAGYELKPRDRGVAPPPEPGQAAPREVARIGAVAPLWPLSSHTDTLVLSPTAPDAGALSGIGGKGDDGAVVGADGRASGGLGPVGLDAAVRSKVTGPAPSDGTAWLGGRVRLYRAEREAFEIAPLLHVVVPTRTGRAVELDPGLSLGGVAGKLSWVTNLAGRARLTERDAAGSPGRLALLTGVTYDLASFLRGYLLLDGHYIFGDGVEKRVRPAGTLGLEAGTRFFAGLGVRVSPLEPAGDVPYAAQLTLGFRGDAR